MRAILIISLLTNVFLIIGIKIYEREVAKLVNDIKEAIEDLKKSLYNH